MPWIAPFGPTFLIVRFLFYIIALFGIYVLLLRDPCTLFVKGLIILRYIDTFVLNLVRVSSFESETFKPYLEPRLKWRHFPLIFKVPWLLA